MTEKATAAGARGAMTGGTSSEAGAGTARYRRMVDD